MPSTAATLTPAFSKALPSWSTRLCRRHPPGVARASSTKRRVVDRLERGADLALHPSNESLHSRADRFSHRPSRLFPWRAILSLRKDGAPGAARWGIIWGNVSAQSGGVRRCRVRVGTRRFLCGWGRAEQSAGEPVGDGGDGRGAGRAGGHAAAGGAGGARDSGGARGAARTATASPLSTPRSSPVRPTATAHPVRDRSTRAWRRRNEARLAAVLSAPGNNRRGVWRRCARRRQGGSRASTDGVATRSSREPGARGSISDRMLDFSLRNSLLLAIRVRS